ncbi:Vacuolar protein sorting-associated protein 35 [Galdieria sulphuraria]|nr:Vacuolar protein sorting-associated protein 35 [Galdieria sulphuraria]
MERALRKPEDEHTKRRNATCLKIKEETHLRRSGSSSNVHHRNDVLKRRSASLSALSKIANSSERASPRNTNAKYNSDGNNINVNKESNSAMEHAEQQKLMRETAQELRKNSVLLRQAIEKEDLVEVLARATEVLQALRIPTIHPRLYYELYLAVNNELRHLEWFFFDQVKRNQITALKLYEQVQETPHVLSRLYLLIVAGTVYMGVERKLTKKYTQRSYGNVFSKLSENREDNENEQLGITTQEAIEFLLWNFGEANRLWIRMQYDANKERLKRDQERRQVETLVGLNISTLAHLSGLNVSLYSNVIFPTISQQICSCHDPIAQEYLADCVVQAFPDEYHLQTLSEFLTMCMKLIPGVSIRQVIGGLADRFAKFSNISLENRKLVEDCGTFLAFEKHLPSILSSQGNSLSLLDVLSTLLSLTQFTLKAYPGQVDYIHTLLGFAIDSLRNSNFLSRKAQEKSSYQSDDTNVGSTIQKSLQSSVVLEEGSPEERLIVRLLTSPLEEYRTSLLRNHAEYRPCIGAVETLEKLFEFIRPLVEESPGEIEFIQQQKNANSSQVHPFHAHLPREVVKVSTTKVRVAEDDSGYFEQVQVLVARIVYLLDETDSSSLFGLYRVIRRYLYRGGPRRTCITLPPLTFACLRLAHRRYKESTLPKTLSSLSEADAVTSLRLYLQGALALSQCAFRNDTLLYEFLARAYLLYEQELPTRELEPDNYDTLSSKAVKHAAKLLTRADQCLALCACAQLFWTPWLMDASRTFACLERAFRSAKSCLALGERSLLFVDILNASMNLYESGCMDIHLEFFVDIIHHVQEVTNRMGNESSIGKAASARLTRAMNYMRKVEPEKYTNLLHHQRLI